MKTKQKIISKLTKTNLTFEKNFYAFMIDDFNFDDYDALVKKYNSIKINQKKYLDLSFWIERKIITTNTLIDDLCINNKSCNFFEIGPGPGHMAYMLKSLGHKVIGMDIPQQDLYNDLFELFGERKITHQIQPEQPIPKIHERIDHIFAISACFFRVGDKKSNHRLFTLEEWYFFINDLKKLKLNKNAKFYMTMNPCPHASGIKFSDPRFISFIRDLNGEISGQKVILPLN
jgi:SAM-dependent methyltransferase